jgi:hypothetical protein
MKPPAIKRRGKGTVRNHPSYMCSTLKFRKHFWGCFANHGDGCGSMDRLQILSCPWDLST